MRKTALGMYRHLLGPDFHRLRRFTFHGTRRTLSGIRSLPVSSRCRLNDENSRGKVQNVRADSSAACCCLLPDVASSKRHAVRVIAPPSIDFAVAGWPVHFWVSRGSRWPTEITRKGSPPEIQEMLKDLQFAMHSSSTNRLRQ
jgi:hypothetical protein